MSEKMTSQNDLNEINSVPYNKPLFQRNLSFRWSITHNHHTGANDSHRRPAPKKPSSQKSGPTTIAFSKKLKNQNSTLPNKFKIQETPPCHQIRIYWYQTQENTSFPTLKFKLPQTSNSRQPQWTSFFHQLQPFSLSLRTQAFYATPTPSSIWP